MNTELENSIKLVETINNQKMILQSENEELKSRINELVNEKASNIGSAIDNIASNETN